MVMTSLFFEENEKSMANTTEAIRQSASKLGLMMSYKKTEILPVGQHNIPNPNVPLSDEGDIRVVEHRCVLQCTYAHGTITKELNYKTGKAAGVFRELGSIWKDRYISLPYKMQVYNACVASTPKYGAEC